MLAQALQEVVSSVRNARAEYGVELGRKIPAQLLIADAELSSALQAEMPVLCSLAKLDEARVMPVFVCVVSCLPPSCPCVYGLMLASILSLCVRSHACFKPLHD